VSTIKTFIRTLVPRAILDARIERHFFRNKRWWATHLGEFGSFDEANAYISKRANPTNYILDHEKWLRRRETLSPHDYPVAFWVDKLINHLGQKNLVDFGGSVGVSYYAMKKYMTFPEDLSWIVCELKEVVERGLQISAQRGETQIQFSSDLSVIHRAPIFMALGSLQYLEATLYDLLVQNENIPSYLIVNKLPLSSIRSFVTIESAGDGLYPCRVQLEASFLADMGGLGYRLVDRWKCLEHNMQVALRPELSFRSFDGFVFSRDNTLRSAVSDER
jgi:putative methyltransferase (TIGR04325 family)